jgi:hypothetical protein
VKPNNLQQCYWKLTFLRKYQIQVFLEHCNSVILFAFKYLMLTEEKIKTVETTEIVHLELLLCAERRIINVLMILEKKFE